MRVDGYGLPSAVVLEPCAREVAGQIESCCRRWLASPSRRRLLPLIRLLAGVALLGRLTGDRQMEQRARAAFRRFRAKGPRRRPEETVPLCLELLYVWHWRPDAVRRYREGLDHLGNRALGELREQPADAAATALAQRHRALSRVTDDRIGDDSGETAGAACRRLLAEDVGEKFRQAAGRRLNALTGSLDAVVEEERRHVLYRLARELQQLILAAQLCRVRLPAPQIRQMHDLVMLHLRTTPQDWPDGSLAMVLRLSLVLQSGLYGNGPRQDMTSLLRVSGCFLHDWWCMIAADLRASGPASEYIQGQARVETRADLMVIARLSRQSMRGRELALVCARLAKLHLNLHGLGRAGLAWWADCLQQALLSLLQTGRAAGPEWRARLRRLRERVLVADGGMTPADRLEAARDEIRVVTARNVVSAVPAATAGDSRAIREPASTRTSLIGQLSGELWCIADPEPWLRRLADPALVRERADWLRTIQQELALLEKGARALGVHRVEALTRVLAEVYRQSDLMQPGRSAGRPDPAVIEALRRGHAGLLYRLDQAAAWQEVSRPRAVIERLYRCLEARHGAVGNAGLSPRQRCIDLNRRVADLVTSASSTTGLREQRTLLTTLLRDQARLLREEW